MVTYRGKPIRYRCFRGNRIKKNDKRLQVIGIDTEAYYTGKCYMICTSKGDTFTPLTFPRFFFQRKYRDKVFVAYNLRYDEGALIQWFPYKNLKELRLLQETFYDGYKVKLLSGKMLKITSGKHCITIYDLLNFFEMSLDTAAKKFLGEGKIDIESKTFYPGMSVKKLTEIRKYCIKDAVLCERLADALLDIFEEFGIKPKQLFSTAWVSYCYFRAKTNYVTVEKYYGKEDKMLQFALNSYRGGKFEVTRKGPDNYWEYDIVSAYPYEMSNLVDIRDARIVYSKTYIKSAQYGFIHVVANIPLEVHSPVAIKKNAVCYYPSGEVEAYITKTELEYLYKYKVDVKIIEAVWLMIPIKTYPYKTIIEELIQLKKHYKETGDKFRTHTVKLIANSAYGKLIQNIDKGNYYQVGGNWNPIYAAIITANCRVRVTEMQQKYSNVVAVHTDSLISTTELPLKIGKELGDWDFELAGKGVVVGCGVYQIGEKVRLRGFSRGLNLIEMCKRSDKTLDLQRTHVMSWKEIMFRNGAKEDINKFIEETRSMRPAFDSKRLWIDDYSSFQEMLVRNVESVPLVFSSLLRF